MASGVNPMTTRNDDGRRGYYKGHKAAV